MIVCHFNPGRYMPKTGDFQTVAKFTSKDKDAFAVSGAATVTVYVVIDKSSVQSVKGAILVKIPKFTPFK